MNFRNRTLARVGAVALFAAGALAAGAPAYAAGTETDLELAVAGTKLAAESGWKLGAAKITNKGQHTPSKVTITADLSKLDLDKVFAGPLPEGECEEDGKALTVTCTLAEDEIPGPGETVEIPVIVLRAPGGPYSGPVTFTVNSPDDTNPDNNWKTVNVEVGEESGVDLGVIVPDVKTAFVSETEERPLRPGDTTAVVGHIFNWGDVAARGLRVTIQLPEQVTFAEQYEGCAYDADNRKATCTYENLGLNPADDELGNGYHWGWAVKVDAGVKTPVTLPDGAMTVEALGVAPVGLNAMAVPQLPENVTPISPREAGVTEVDASDNVDDFAVILAGDGGAGGGDEGPGAGNGGGAGGGGSLPVTGVQAGVIGGAGVAALALGGVLFMLARRRRVVLVTPGDEKPSA